MDDDHTANHEKGYLVSSPSIYSPAPEVRQRGSLGFAPTLLVSFCCAFAALGAFLFGYDIGIISSAIAQDDFKLHFGNGSLSEDATGGIVSSFTAGAIIGTLAVSWLSDGYGRRAAIFTGALFACLGGALQGGANVLVTLILGRLLSGVGVGLVSPTIPNYCSEVAPPRIRGMLGGMQQWMIGLGIVTAQWVGYGGSLIQGPASWRLSLALQIAPALLLGLGTWFLPESPRYLAEKGDMVRSYQVLEKLHLGRREANRDLVDAEFRQIKDTVRAAKAEAPAHRWRILLSKPSLRRRLLLACGIQLFTQCSGTNVIAYYSPIIYDVLGFSTQRSLFILGLYGALALVFNTICLAFVDRIGRRKLLIPSMIGMGAALCVEATLAKYYFASDNSNVARDSNGNALRASVAMNFVFALFFTSLGVLSWIYPSEIFPTAMRAKGTSLSTFTNWAANLIIAQCSPLGLARLRYRYFYIFTAFNWTAAILVYFFFPETHGHSLEEISGIFGDFTADGAQPPAHQQFH